MTRSRAWLGRLIAWSPVMMLGALAGLTYWLNAQIRPPVPAFDGSSRHDPDLFVDNFKAINLDSNGRIREALTASRAEHFPDDDTTHFDSPAMTLTDPGKPQLKITSDHGILTGDRQHAYFIGHVDATRDGAAGDADDGPIRLTSEYLHVIPKENRIITDKPVTISDPHGIINATGMEFDSNTKTVKFQSHVSGQVQPQKVQPHK